MVIELSEGKRVWMTIGSGIDVNEAYRVNEGGTMGDTDLVLLGQQILTADGESGGDDSLEDGREL